MYVPWGNMTNHNIIPFVGLKPLQSDVMFIVEGIVINGWWLVGTIGGIMTGLWCFTFEADKLQAIRSMVHTKDEMERWNRWCNNVGKGNEVLNGTITVIGPLIKSYLWIIDIVVERRHGWVCSGIFFTAFDGMGDIRWRKWSDVKLGFTGENLFTPR